MSELLVTKSEKELLGNKGFKLFKLLLLGSDSKIYLSCYENKEKMQRYYLCCKVYDTRKMQRKFLVKFLPREINTLLNISHPNIVQIHCIFKWKTKYYIFMRYAERGDLFDYIKSNGRVEEPQLSKWFKQLCSALNYLHDLNIVHRDLKCENILLTRNFTVKLADFGFSRLSVDQKDEDCLCYTYCGSISYTAPEIIKGVPYYPKPADLWSLGVVLYIMTNKSMPFYDENITKLYTSQMNKKWKFKSKYEAFIHENIKTLIRELLDPQPSTRLTIEQVIESKWLTENQASSSAGVPIIPTAKISYRYMNRYIITTSMYKKDMKAYKAGECLMIKDIVSIVRSDATVPDEEMDTMTQDEKEITPKEKERCCSIL